MNEFLREIFKGELRVWYFRQCEAGQGDCSIFFVESRGFENIFLNHLEQREMVKP